MKKKFLRGTRQKQRQRTILTLLAGSVVLSVLIYVLLLITGNLASTKTKAAPGIHGEKVISSGTVILNEYTALTANASAGSTQLTVSSNNLNTNNRFSCALGAGELILIIQMQGATITETNNSTYGNISNYNNCGKYEFAEVSSVTGTTKINLNSPLTKSYTYTGKVQVIRVPRYQNLTIDYGATVTSPSWDGSTGGIIAVEVNQNTTVNGTMDVSGKGFRGGVVEQNTKTPGNHSDYRSTNNQDGAEKGESIAGYQAGYSLGRYGRGAPANGGGGGNSHNAAGGGGSNGNNGIAWNGKGNPDNSNSNWTIAWNLELSGFSSNTSSGGGRGGYGWSNTSQDPLTVAPNNALWGGDSRYNMGGFGGRPLDYSGGRIFMGGGGGAGDSNDNKGTGGASGGGIIIILSGQGIQGTGSLIANGNAAAAVSGSGNMDAPGGGGGGGAIIAFCKSGSVNGLTIEAKGGKGGNWIATGSTTENEGAGGGGGGGYISITNPSGLTQLVNGGEPGENENPIMANFKVNGATRGGSGQTAVNPPNPYSGIVALPVVLTSFSGGTEGNNIVLHWSTASESNNKSFTIEESNDARTFILLGTVNGSGNSSQASSYSLTDFSPVNGNNYYRLTQTDQNGHATTYQPIVVVYNKIGATASASVNNIYPNPFTDRFILYFQYQGEEDNAQVQITDLNGKMVQFQMVNLVKGNNNIIFDKLDHLTAGIYFLSFKTSGQTLFHRKIIKSKSPS